MGISLSIDDIMGKHLVGLDDGELWMMGCAVYLCILVYIYPETKVSPGHPEDGY